MATSQLVLEQRRHRRLVFTLLAGCVAAGVAVSNERGVFVPPHGLGAAFAATARAFAALAAPGGRLQLFNPSAAYAYALPNEIAQRVINPPVPAANPFPGVFGGPQGAPAAPQAAPGGGAGAPPPGGGTGVADAGPGGLGPLAPPGVGGFTGVPIPIQDLGTTTPTQPGIDNPPVITPGGGNLPPFVVSPPGILPPPGIGTPPTPPTIVIPPLGPPVINPPVTNPPVVNPPVTNPPVITPCVGLNCPTNPPVPPVTTPENPPTSAIPEPASWAMLILGFGIVGGLQRLVVRRKRRQAV